MDRSRRMAQEVYRQGQILKAQNDAPPMTFFLLDSRTKDSIIKVFQKLGYDAAAKDMESLSELQDFLVVEESKSE
jgi:hypothetical protein